MRCNTGAVSPSHRSGFFATRSNKLIPAAIDHETISSMSNRALFSSASEEWVTPQNLFDRLDNVYQFQLDACATANNAKCALFFDKKQNSLAQDWASYGRVWMNPPYGRTIGNWMQKAYLESKKGCLVVCLVPARTDTRWWHDWVECKAHVTFVRGRLKFNRTDQPVDETQLYPAPFASVIVSYEPSLFPPRANLFVDVGADDCRPGEPLPCP